MWKLAFVEWHPSIFNVDLCLWKPIASFVKWEESVPRQKEYVYLNGNYRCVAAVVWDPKAVASQTEVYILVYDQ